MYKYIHDASARTVYKMPTEPEVSVKNDSRGRRTGWSANMEIHITRADNKFIDHRWQHDILLHPRDPFDAHYTKEEVISYFLSNHTPDGEDISLEQYIELHAQYEAIARNSSSE